MSGSWNKVSVYNITLISGSVFMVRIRTGLNLLVLFCVVLHENDHGNIFSPTIPPAFVALIMWFYLLYVYIKINILVYIYIDIGI